jgi:hypothetical protein
METLIVKNKKFVIDHIQASHDDHISYIAVYAGVKYLVRVYMSGYQQALADYKTLKHAGINMAKVAYHDDDNHIIAFDYFPEKDVLEMLAESELPQDYFKALFSLYRFCRFSKISLDWEPQNFMMRGSQMFYLPLKVQPMKEGNRLEDDGLRYWFHGEECLALLKRKNFDISKITPMESNQVNKNMVLMSVAYW